MVETAANLSSLLSNATLSRVERMRLQPMRRLTDHRRGEHLYGKGGQSTEFSDYRDYAEGDDIKFVDWNIFARLERPYLKLFHHEEEMQVVVVIDASQSMAFEGKLALAKQLAAAAGVMGLFAMEKVSAYAFGQSEARPAKLPPCTGRASLGKLLRFVEAVEPGGGLPVEDGIERVLREHRGRGVVMLISDFLTFRDPAGALTRLASVGLELFAVQVLGPSEIDPDLDGDSRLVDSEGAGTLDVSMGGDLLGIYQEYRQRFERHLETACRQRGGRFTSVSADATIETVLFDTLTRKGWVR